MLFTGKFCNEVLRDALFLKGEERYGSILEKTDWAEAVGVDEHGLFSVLHDLKFRFIPEFQVPRNVDRVSPIRRDLVRFPVPAFWYQESPLTLKDWDRLNISNHHPISSTQPVRYLNRPQIQQFIGNLSGVRLPTTLEWESACFQAYSETKPGWGFEYGVEFSSPIPESGSFWNEKCDLDQLLKRTDLCLEDELALKAFIPLVHSGEIELPSQSRYYPLPVKCFPANKLGLYDFLHTIGEWAFDETSGNCAILGGIHHNLSWIDNPDRQSGYFSHHGIRLVRPV